MKKAIEDAMAELRKMNLINADLMLALGWYANPKNYGRAPDTYGSYIDGDGGKKARKSLGIDEY